MIGNALDFYFIVVFLLAIERGIIILSNQDAYQIINFCFIFNNIMLFQFCHKV